MIALSGSTSSPTLVRQAHQPWFNRRSLSPVEGRSLSMSKGGPWAQSKWLATVYRNVEKLFIVKSILFVVGGEIDHIEGIICIEYTCAGTHRPKETAFYGGQRLMLWSWEDIYWLLYYSNLYLNSNRITNHSIITVIEI